jgi:hypothetical protein
MRIIPTHHLKPSSESKQTLLCELSFDNGPEARALCGHISGRRKENSQVVHYAPIRIERGGCGTPGLIERCEGEFNFGSSEEVRALDGALNWN